MALELECKSWRTRRCERASEVTLLRAMRELKEVDDDAARGGHGRDAVGLHQDFRTRSPTGRLPLSRPSTSALPLADSSAPPPAALPARREREKTNGDFRLGCNTGTSKKKEEGKLGNAIIISASLRMQCIS